MLIKKYIYNLNRIYITMSKIIGIYIDEESLKRLDEIAKEELRSRSNLIRKWIDEHPKNRKNKLDPFD